MRTSLKVLLVVLLLTLPAVVQAQFTFTTNNGTITITGYTGLGGDVTIPDTTNGLRVTSIGTNAFSFCTNLTSVTILNSVTSIENNAFYSCTGLTNISLPNSITSIGRTAFFRCMNLRKVTIPSGVTSLPIGVFQSCYNLQSMYCEGNAPAVGWAALSGANELTVYYLAGTTGWDKWVVPPPAILWNPQPQNLGVYTNQLGFTITGSSNLVIVVEACTNPANASWSPVGTNTLNTFIGTNGTSYFSDPQWTNYPGRFYRSARPETIQGSSVCEKSARHFNTYVQSVCHYRAALTP